MPGGVGVSQRTTSLKSQINRRHRFNKLKPKVSARIENSANDSANDSAPAILGNRAS